MATKPKAPTKNPKLPIPKDKGEMVLRLATHFRATKARLCVQFFG